VVSNWDERLRPLLDALGLAPFFEVMVISCEVGQAKPAGAMFQRCLQALRLPPPAVLHIGDSLEEDEEGARRAGLRAARVQRRGGRPRAGAVLNLADALPDLE
jgi:putative hydrolase of the HAD superfamily